MMIWVFLVFLVSLTGAQENDTSLLCSDAFSCPGRSFDIESHLYYVDHDGDWRTKVFADFFDHFCPFYAEYINCTEDYEPLCEGNNKAVLQTQRATYDEICILYKSDIEALIDPCVNDLTYQSQLIDVCEPLLLDYGLADNTPDMIDACRGPKEWASCVHNVVKACYPEKAYVVPLVFEASKPYICYY